MSRATDAVVMNCLMSSPSVVRLQVSPKAWFMDHKRPKAASELPRMPSVISRSIQDQLAGPASKHMATGDVLPIPRGSKPKMS